MLPRADLSGHAREQLHTALLEYAKAPGKYHVALRQPALLFASIREILQLAVGREHDTAPVADPDKAALRNAACFFTRTALLSPSADHYALLGLGRNFDGLELKDRYRLLMRLIHPDFAGATSGSWPADAAVRVNLAYEVLSSSVRRREYDAQLGADSSSSSAVVKVVHLRMKAAARDRPKGMARSRLKHLAVVCSVVAAFVVLFSLLAGGPDGVHLVQRVRPPVTEHIIAAVQESVAAPATSMPDLAVPEPVARVPAQQQAELPVAGIPSMPPLQAESAVDRASTIKTTAKTSEASGAAALTMLVPAPQSRPAVEVTAKPPPPHAAEPSPPPEPAPALALTLPPAPPPAPIPVRVAPSPDPAPPPATEAQAASPTVSRPQATPPPLPRPMPIPGLSLAEAQPLLSLLLQQLESGRGERLINLLDREARGKPGAQALSQQYDGLVDGLRPVRLSHVEFKAEPAEGRLVVTGNIRLQVGEQTIGSMGKKMVVRAEFTMRQGTVVMTGLSSAPADDK